MTVAIRPARPDDVSAITRIYAHAVEHGTASFELTPPDETEMARRMQDCLSKNFPYLVAEHAGTIAGYAYAATYRARPAYRWTVEDTVYVAPELHRRGIGRALLAELIAQAEARGFRQMIAVIGDSTLQTPSIRLHASLGFREVGTYDAVGFKLGRWLDSVLMQRALGEGSATIPD